MPDTLLARIPIDDDMAAEFTGPETAEDSAARLYIAALHDELQAKKLLDQAGERQRRLADAYRAAIDEYGRLVDATKVAEQALRDAMESAAKDGQP